MALFRHRSPSTVYRPPSTVHMHKTLLPFDKVPALAKTDVAYATSDKRLADFYRYPPRLDAFTDVLINRAGKETPREALVEVLMEQYGTLPQSPLVLENIEALRINNTFTVTTAHQPSLFLGPLYFLYKAFTTINLAESIQKSSGKGQRIVPVFVLGSEDHDLEELNHINLFNKRLEWQSGESGAVGSMSAASIKPLLTELKTILGESDLAKDIFSRVERAYIETSTFAEATQALLNELFGRFGLVVLNMNHPVLKRYFIPVMKAELLEQSAFRIVSKTGERLAALGFKTQATPREINLFYMKPGMRERIVLENGVYKVLNTNIVFDEAAILAELEAHPENFSPNVILRPLFQEMILPNLAYVGGGGELAYWLERKDLFDHFSVPFPMLVRRNSVLWLDRDVMKNLHKFGFTPVQFFEDTETLVRAFITANAEGEVHLNQEVRDLKDIFERLAQKALVIDPTLEKAVRAEAVKSVSAFEQWESRLVRAEKQKHEVILNKIRVLKEKLFPGNGLQERSDNFLPYYLKYGEGFLDALKEHLQPFDPGFIILEEA